MPSIKVFVASPSDLHVERDALAGLVEELNQFLAVVTPEREVALELIRWETHSAPNAGRPQQVITDSVGRYDIFVGIMWRRFGTPTGEADSGTQEEFELAYARWERERKPDIMFYFCQAPSAPPKSREEAEQLLRVATFRDALAKRALIWEYAAHEEFRSVVRPHLLKAIGRLIGSRLHEHTPRAPLRHDALRELERKLVALAHEYQGVRNDMEPGSVRTRRMKLIATKIRTLALQGEPLLARFTEGITPGERLVASAFLQVTPKCEYLSWLGERMGEQQPFLGYHAAVALLAAARNLDCFFKTDVANAVNAGIQRLRANGVDDGADRSRTLRQALDEIHLRCGDESSDTRSLSRR